MMQISRILSRLCHCLRLVEGVLYICMVMKDHIDFEFLELLPNLLQQA